MTIIYQVKKKINVEIVVFVKKKKKLNPNALYGTAVFTDKSVKGHTPNKQS